jgi:hypothetical protein
MNTSGFAQKTEVFSAYFIITGKTALFEPYPSSEDYATFQQVFTAVTMKNAVL